MKPAILLIAQCRRVNLDLYSKRIASEMNHIGITSLVITQGATQSFFKLAHRQFTFDFSDQGTQVIYLQGIEINVLASLG